MDIVLDLQDDSEETALEIGFFKDLKYLVELLDEAWEKVDYRLEKVDGQKDLYLFVEDPVDAFDYECGIVEKRGAKVFAFSPAVHAMVMAAYQRYVDAFGEIQ